MSFYFALEDDSGDDILLEDGSGKLLLELIEGTYTRHIMREKPTTENTKTTVNRTVVAVLK